MAAIFKNGNKYVESMTSDLTDKSCSTIDSITTSYPEITTSDKGKTLFGKIKKYLNDLKNNKLSLSGGTVDGVTIDDNSISVGVSSQYDHDNLGFWMGKYSLSEYDDLCYLSFSLPSSLTSSNINRGTQMSGYSFSVGEIDRGGIMSFANLSMAYTGSNSLGWAGALSLWDGETYYSTDYLTLNAHTGIQWDKYTGNKALITNSNKRIVESAVTDTELGYLSGVTSNIQTQLNTLKSSSVIQHPYVWSHGKITNWNNAIDFGIYQASNATNAPVTGWITVIVIPFDNNTGWCRQIAFCVGAHNIYSRYKSKNTWSTWLALH